MVSLEVMGAAGRIPETKAGMNEDTAITVSYTHLASHVVIDEAQDFGMMAYGALKYCLSKCTYTIMGDVSQSVSP